jgi:plasmid stabilization system protein ParE
LKVIWSPTAADAAQRIQERLAEFSPRAANDFTDRIDSRLSQLAEYPFSGRVVPEYGLPLIRELIEGDYRIIYETFPDRVEILTIKSGREELPRS